MFKFLWVSTIVNFKRFIALKMAFFISVGIIIAKQLLFLVTWNFFFDKYKLINGWNFSDLLVMYGIFSFATGFVEIFFYGIRELPKIVESGRLDVFLLQPRNLILNIASSKGDVLAIGELLTGVILMAYSGYLLSSFLLFLLILPTSILFIFTLYLYLGCISFFIQNSTNFIKELFQNVGIIATQPNSAYRGLFRIITFTILPTGFLSFFPVEYLRTDMLRYLIISVGGTLIFFVLACYIFKAGLKRYESGNMILHRY